MISSREKTCPGRVSRSLRRERNFPVSLIALNRGPVTPDPELAEQIYLDTLDHVDSFGLPPGPNSVRSKHSGFCSSTPAG